MKKLLILSLFLIVLNGCEKPPQKIVLLNNKGHKHIVITDECLKTCWLCNYKGIKKYIRKARKGGKR